GRAAALRSDAPCCDASGPATTGTARADRTRLLLSSPRSARTPLPARADPGLAVRAMCSRSGPRAWSDLQVPRLEQRRIHPPHSWGASEPFPWEARRVDLRREGAVAGGVRAGRQAARGRVAGHRPVVVALVRGPRAMTAMSATNVRFGFDEVRRDDV